MLTRLAPLLVLAMSFTAAAETGFLNRSVSVEGHSIRYVVYVPSDYTPDRAWPIVLFLHGAGERGSDGLVQTEVGIGTAIRRHVDRFPAIVVMPQCPKDTAWWRSAEIRDLAMAALEQSRKEFHTDPKRVYLTGLSMGGYGSWALAQSYPNKFAAIMPICGGLRLPVRIRNEDPTADPGEGVYESAAKKIGAKTPIWIFHGGADPTVPPEESRKMYAALKDIGANVKYTEYEGIPHNSWDKTYNDANVIQWLFEQTLP